VGDSCKLDVVVFREGTVWVSQCLQHNIAAQGENLRECLDALRSVLLARIAAAANGLIDDPFKDVPPAPRKYWERYEEALKLSPEESPFQRLEGIPTAFMIRPSDLELRVYG
jgi:hypothetical protein